MISGRWASHCGVSRLGAFQSAGRKATTDCAPQRSDMNTAHRRLRQRHDRQVEAACGEPGHAVVGGQHLHVHVDAGMVPGKTFERGRQQVRNGACRGTHPHAARLAGELTSDVFHCVVRVCQQPAGTRDEALSQGGRLRGPPPANEQLATQARLQFRDLNGDGGCRQVKGARSIGQRPEVGDGDKGAQMVKAQFPHIANLTFLNLGFHIFSWSH